MSRSFRRWPFTVFFLILILLVLLMLCLTEPKQKQKTNTRFEELRFAVTTPHIIFYSFHIRRRNMLLHLQLRICNNAMMKFPSCLRLAPNRIYSCVHIAAATKVSSGQIGAKWRLSAPNRSFSVLQRAEGRRAADNFNLCYQKR